MSKKQEVNMLQSSRRDTFIHRDSRRGLFDVQLGMDCGRFLLRRPTNTWQRRGMVHPHLMQRPHQEEEKSRRVDLSVGMSTRRLGMESSECDGRTTPLPSFRCEEN